MDARQPPENHVIPSEVALSFGCDRQLPDGAQVWIASYTGTDDQIPAFAGLGIDLDDRQDPRPRLARSRGEHLRCRSLRLPGVLGDSGTRDGYPRADVSDGNTHRPSLAIEPAIWRHQPGLGAAEVVAFAEQIPASLRGSLVLSEPVAERG